MINKEQFTKYIKLVESIENTQKQLESLGIDLFSIYEDFYGIMDLVIESSFDDFGSYIFFQWKWENRKQVTDEDGTIYELDSIDNLWKFLSKHPSL